MPQQRSDREENPPLREDWLSGILSQVGYATITTESEGCVTYMNDLAETLTGWKFENARGEPLDKIFYITQKVVDNRIHYPFEVARGKGESGKDKNDTYLVNRHGKKMPIDINTSPILDDQKMIIGQVIVFRDISEQRRNEAENRKIREQLVQAQKMSALGKLAGGVAHDFNNLLTIIQIVADMGLIQKNQEEYPLCNELKQIQIAAQRAAKLTRQLLLYSKKRSINPTFLNLNTTIESLLEMLQRLLGANITVATHLEPTVWSIFADEGEIEQIIMNLLINARDAMPNGGDLVVRTENVNLNGSLKIPESVKPGKYVCLSIRDTGIGMTPQKKQRIFESFYSDKKQGTGLGLSVVYGIVQQLGGYIDVYSELGKGSIFKIYIPIASTEPIISDEESKLIPSLQGNNERILIVEDEASLRNLIERILCKNGYDVQTASNLEEAIQIFNKEAGKFQLVLSDVVLPDGNGLDLVDWLRTSRPDIDILLSSGYSDSKWYWSEIKKRGFPLLHKPYTIPVLLQNVKEAMVSRQDP